MTAAAKLSQHIAAALGEISLAAFARDILGTKSSNPGRVGRDWCQTRGVQYRRDGKVNWVRIEDLRTALARLPLAGTPAANTNTNVPNIEEWG